MKQIPQAPRVFILILAGVFHPTTQGYERFQLEKSILIVLDV
jgi:hypothetical protein